MIQSRIVLPDLHVPFHDKKLLECWMTRLTNGNGVGRFHGVDIIGDFIDCYSLSRFDSNPARKNTFQQEVDEGNEILNKIRQIAPNADIRYSEGNHEDRLRKLLWGKAPALAHLRNFGIPHVMGLENLEVQYYRTEEPYKIGDLWYGHGDLLRKHAGMSARAKGDAMGGSVIIGHTHRLGYCPFTMHTGTWDAYEVGYMADPTQLDYHRHVFNWQLGWAEVNFRGGYHWVNFYRVVDRGRERVVVGPDGVVGKWRTRR